MLTARRTLVPHLRLDVEDWRSIEHVNASNVEQSVFTAKQLDDGETDWVWTAWGSSGEHAMWPIVGRRRAEQIEAMGAVEGPDDHEMREALNVGEPKFEFRQDAEDTFCVVLCAKAFRNGGCIFVGTVYKSNSLRRKTFDPLPPLPILCAKAVWMYSAASVVFVLVSCLGLPYHLDEYRTSVLRGSDFVEEVDASTLNPIRRLQAE